MYHSVWLYNGYEVINTWNDWHLIPETRPFFGMPKKKTNYVDIPGGDSSLDLSNILTNGLNTYSNREGSWTFYLPFPTDDDNYNYGFEYNTIINKIESFFNKSNTFRCNLEDDISGNYPYNGMKDVRYRTVVPIYTGDFWIENVTITNDGSHSSIEIGYNVKPYWIGADNIAGTTHSLTPKIISQEYDQVITKDQTDGYIDIYNFVNGIYETYGTTRSLKIDAPLNLIFTPIAVNLAGAPSYEATEDYKKWWLIYTKFTYDNVENNTKPLHGVLPHVVGSYMNIYHKNNPEATYLNLESMETTIKTLPNIYGDHYPGLLLTKNDIDKCDGSLKIKVSNTQLKDNVWTDTKWPGYDDVGIPLFKYNIIVSTYFGGL